MYKKIYICVYVYVYVDPVLLFILFGCHFVWTHCLPCGHVFNGGMTAAAIVVS